MLSGSVRAFIATQNSSAVVLLVAVVAALVWANSPWSSTYDDLWETNLACVSATTNCPSIYATGSTTD